MSSLLWGYVNSLTVLVLKTSHAAALRTLMDSAVDYTINGVRNRWCFTSTWAVNSTCLLTDINNVERLMLSDEALRSIEAGMPPASYNNSISTLRTKSITATVAFTNIVPGHPLYYALTGLQSLGSGFNMTFTITRMDNGLSKGREVALQIKVDLNTNSPILGLSGNVLTAVSTIMVFPRELSTNALVIANDLYLDRADPGIGSASPGDVYIAGQPAAGDPGIRFESPVFVNNNIYVPDETSTGYTPVTFADKVIVGGGTVMSQVGSTGVYAAPQTAGGQTDRYFSQTSVFGGFLNGVLLDPGPDMGLRIFAGVASPATTPNYGGADLCVRRNNAKAELAMTRDSQLYIKYDSSSSTVPAFGATTNVDSTYVFLADLGAVDSFYAQGNIGAANQTRIYSPAALSPTLTYNDPSPAEQRPIMKAQISINGWSMMPGAYVSVELARDAVTEIPMSPTDPASIIRITTSPVTVGANVQPQTVSIKVELIKQEAFNIFPYAVKVPLSSVTTSLEGSIDIRLEAYDVAYVTNTVAPWVTSNRTKGSPSLDPLSAAECPVDLPLAPPGAWTLDVQTFGSTTYHCYSKFAWHPEMKKYKNNGFSFARSPGGLDKRFLLVRDPTATGMSGYFTCPKFDSSCQVYSTNDAPLAQDMIAFDQSCNVPPVGTSLFPSFAAADWSSANFVDQTRRSWGFSEAGTAALPGYNSGTLILDNTNASFGAATFITKGIYNTCEIANTANFVTGFFVCDNLIIDNGRTSPLRIIGTFIVGHMSVSPSAIAQGVRWSNIYHPSAVYELRAAGILSTGSAAACDDPTDPLWQPFPSVQRAQYQYKCNPVSLRSKADPFKWTLMDPDCGVVGPVQQCKNRVMRYEIMELRRQEYL